MFTVFLQMRNLQIITTFLPLIVDRMLEIVMVIKRCLRFKSTQKRTELQRCISLFPSFLLVWIKSKLSGKINYQGMHLRPLE